MKRMLLVLAVALTSSGCFDFGSLLAPVEPLAVSGRVTQGGQAVEGVTVSLATTNYCSGFWAFPCGWWFATSDANGGFEIDDDIDPTKCDALVVSFFHQGRGLQSLPDTLSCASQMVNHDFPAGPS